MEEKFSVSVKGLEKGEATRLGHAVLAVVRVLEKAEPILDLRRMHRIIVSADFPQELGELSSRTFSGSDIDYTNEDYAIAIAKVLTLRKGNDFEILPVFSAQFALRLLPEHSDGCKSEDFRYSLHLVHHGLSHVHDNNKKIDALKGLYGKYSYKGVERYIYPLAENCWSEYIANYLSSSTATEGAVIDMVESFSDALARTKKELDDRILAYRSDSKLDELMEYFSRHGNFLVQAAAYTLGYIDGLGIALDDISEVASERLKNSYFEPVWRGMHEALETMRTGYPDEWANLGVYSDLAEAINEYYDVMGFMLSNHDDDQVYIDIPFRFENS